jgi:hypothetical protein
MGYGHTHDVDDPRCSGASCAALVGAVLAASAAVVMVIIVGAVGMPVGWTAPTAVGLGAADPFVV